jgi:predicted naringenin-chalcone synthase
VSLWHHESFYNFAFIIIGMQILKLATALPERECSTRELLETFPCVLPEGVRQNVVNLGVLKRCLVEQTGSASRVETVLSEAGLVELCWDACGTAIREAGLSAGDVDYLIVTYDVNPFLSPGLSQLLVPRLGLDPYVKHVNSQGVASTAFPKALMLAQDHLALHPEDSVLICVSGVSSYWFQNQVRGINNVMEISQISQIKDQARRQFELRKWVATMQFFLFGDGVASAVVASHGNGLSVKKVAEVTNVGDKDYLAGYARLEVLNEPFKFGFYSHLDKEIPKLGAQYTSLVLERLLGKDADVIKTARKWAVHTGSEKILNLLAERQGIEQEKIEESHAVLRECGNLAGASLPFILDRILSGNTLSKGDIVLMVGYGWGFSAAACLLEST